MLKLMDKKIITILHLKCCLSGLLGPTAYGPCHRKENVSSQVPSQGILLCSQVLNFGPIPNGI